VKCTFYTFSAVYSHFQVTSGQKRYFWVTSRHLRSRDVISCYVTSFYCELQPCRMCNVQYTRVFGLLQPLPGNLRWNDVTSESLPSTWGHVTSFHVTWLPPTASYSLVGREMYSTHEFLAFYSHLQVTSGEMTSLLGHLTSFSVIWLLQTARWSLVKNVEYTQVFGLLQPLPSDFQWNDITCESVPVTCGHVMSFLVMWFPPTASYTLVKSKMYSRREFSAFHSHFQVTSGLITSLPGHFQWPEVMWRHFLSRDSLLLRATAS